MTGTVVLTYDVYAVINICKYYLLDKNQKWNEMCCRQRTALWWLYNTGDLPGLMTWILVCKSQPKIQACSKPHICGITWRGHNELVQPSSLYREGAGDRIDERYLKSLEVSTFSFVKSSPKLQITCRNQLRWISINNKDILHIIIK